LTSLALVFGAVTYLVGDYVAPLSERVASQLRAAFSGGLKLERSGAWIKERSPDGERSCSINVGSAERGSLLRNVRIFEFDADGRLTTRTIAAEADGGGGGTSSLRGGVVNCWHQAAVAPSAREEHLATSQWKSSLSPKVVAAAVLPVTTM